MDHLNPRTTPRNIEVAPRLSLVTPATVAARARAASTRKYTNQQGPALRRRVSKKFTDFIGGGDNDKSDEEDDGVAAGGETQETGGGGG